MVRGAEPQLMMFREGAARSFRRGDLVRVTQETLEAAAGSIGHVIGFYDCDPPLILLRLPSGLAQVPASALAKAAG